MARSHARILTRIWADPDFTALPADAQRLYLALVSQPDLTLCGTLDWNAKRIARLAPDTTPARITKALGQLLDRAYVVVDDDTDELAIRTFLRHDGVTTQPNVLKSAARAWHGIHSTTIKQLVVDQLPPAIAAVWPDQLLAIHPKRLGELINAKGSPQPFGEPSREGFREPSGEGFGEPFPEPFGEPPHDHPDPEARNAKRESSSSGNPSPQPARPDRPRRQQTRPPSDAAPAADDDDLGQAFDLLARRRLDAQRADPRAPRIHRPGPWLTRTAADLRTEHADHARKLLADNPTLTPTQLADLLEPDQPDSHTGPKPITADEAIAHLDERPHDPVPPPTANRHPRTAS